MLNDVYIMPSARMKQEQLIANCKEEIAWLGVVDDQNDLGILLVEDIILPKQEVSTTSVDFEMEHLHEVIAENPDIAHKLRYFGHSHAHMDAYVSSVDWADFIVMMEQTGVPHIICHIENHKGEAVTQIELFELNGQKVRLSVEANLETIIPSSIVDWASSEIEAKVTKKSYKYTGYSTSTKNKGSSSTSVVKKDVTTVESDKGVLHIVHDRSDVPAKGHCVLYTSSHRTEFEDGKYLSSMTIVDWEKRRKEKEKGNDSKKAQANANRKGSTQSKNQTQIVSAHKSVSARSRQRKQQRKREELSELLEHEKKPITIEDDGYVLTIAREADLDKITDDEYEFDNDATLEWMDDISSMSQGYTYGHLI